MKELTCIPFGAQYYRAPTPPEADWESDLTSFRNHGFNTVKLWAQWGWNMPAENSFDFSDLDRLMDICSRLCLNVIINVIYDVAPHWFSMQYPDSMMIADDGRVLRMQATAWRQIGGVPGPCLHHPEGIEIRRRFTERLAEHFAGHPALLCWDLWNEPEVTCGIMRESTQRNMVCYCEHSQREFRSWLEKRYGTVDEVNRHWGRRYGSFEEIEPPRYARTYNDMIDWRSFFAETLKNELHMRVEAIKKYDTEHSVMVHSVPGFDYVNTCAEDYLLAGETDWYGNSNGNNPYCAACITGAAGGKISISSEIHALGGSTLSRPEIPSFDDMKKHVFISLGLGIKGFLFWQYKPERLGWESPAWGLTALDGSDTPWLGYAEKINNALLKNQDILLDAMPESPRVAVIKSSSDEVFLWAVGEESNLMYRKCVEGAFKAFYEANYAVTVISENQLIGERLDGFDIVYYPLPYYVDTRAAQKVKDYVANGGRLISEAMFGGFDSDTGLHAVKLPGYGFDEVFGCTEGETTTASVFRNAYKEKWSDNKGDQTVEFSDCVSGIKGGGYYFRQTFIPTAGEVIARYTNGDAAAVINRYGRGTAVIIGTGMGYISNAPDHEEQRGYTAYLAAGRLGVRPAAVMENGIRCDVLRKDGAPAAMVLRWRKSHGRSVSFSDSTLFGKTLTNAIDGGTIYVDASGVCVIPDSEGMTELYIVS